MWRRQTGEHCGRQDDDRPGPTTIGTMGPGDGVENLELTHLVGRRDQEHGKVDQLFATSFMACRAAAIVLSTSRGVWAADRNQASNCEGGG